MQKCANSRNRFSAPPGPLLFVKLALGLAFATLAACSGGGGSSSDPAVNDAYTTNSGTNLNVVAPGVLANDTGSNLTASWKTSPAHGSLTLNSDGSFSYTNNGDGTPTDSFSYTLHSSGSVVGVATVRLTINQAPVATTSFATIHDDVPPTVTNVAVNLQATDANGNSTIASYTIDTLPIHGSIAGCGVPGCSMSTGTVTYMPTPNSNGTGLRGMDKFTFHVTDSGTPPLSSGTATAWVLNNGNVRIMPLGDSITAGITSGNLPAPADRIGYRYDLYNLLMASANSRYGIDFVGSQSDGAKYSFDLNHEGHPGWCSDNTVANPCTGFDGIAENVSTFLTNHPADVILLHIGTNNFNATYTTGVKSILDNMNTWAQANYPITVMVARIIPANNGLLDVQAFNDSVATMVNDATFQSNHPYLKLFMVNQQTELHLATDSTGNVADPSLMANTLHPTDMNSLTDVNGNAISPGSPYGYGKMAQRWQADLIADGVLPSP
jgi:hypothetical protein